MRSGEGFLICYSVTDKRSFNEVKEYSQLIKRVRCLESIPVVLVGNKVDLRESRQVGCQHDWCLHTQQLAAPLSLLSI